ncbi:hypothetical protein EKH57_16450 [Halorubrum sp. BOL3-1]|uniref:hypothetical protein n=1 Tax=Halorubrum sp. BOL3-1 TaxID=2497325 RepID=UPI001004E802|nr:hypothetical protein [Halorubrum sp. BOL3-1]QAU14145.1 hypothetical protein EKH57_16450 [Halorubrum sp. BOL3-1]
MNSDSSTADSSPPLAGVVVGAFSVVVLLAATAYTVMLAVIDWAAVSLLAYPANAVAPFAVISGAIVTIAVIIPTALITVNKTA